MSSHLLGSGHSWRGILEPSWMLRFRNNSWQLREESTLSGETAAAGWQLREEPTMSGETTAGS